MQLPSRARVFRRARRTVAGATHAAAGLRRRLDRQLAPPGSERALRRRLVADGASLRPRQPGAAWQSWVNRALLGLDEVAQARAEVIRCGLPPHGDAPKNWDLLVALGTILERVSADGAVLDAGAPLYSRLLPWLYLYGYRNLHGIDLVYDGPVRLGPIAYQAMDLTATSFPDGSFDAITCLSVIEHGVPLDAYLDEARRLLRPGGLLITSTDFWSEPVDTGGREAYGVPITIFTPTQMEAFVVAAAERGLRPVRPVDLACRDRAVHWARFELDYTFVNIVLRREG